MRLYQGTGDASCTFLSCRGLHRLSGCRQRMGIEKAGRGRSGREGGKGQAKSCTTTVWTPPHGCLVWGPAAAGGQAAAASPATTAGQPRSSWNTSFPPKLRFPLTAALVSCLLQPDKNNSWPTATISRVSIAQLALPHKSSD